jgi:hypothetical protein
MRTRPYRPEDADAVIGLMAERQDFVETPTDRVVLRLDHRVQLVGCEGGRIVAYASLLCPPWFDASQLSARIVVTADRHNEGIGGAMWREILAVTDSAGREHLAHYVRKENTHPPAVVSEDPATRSSTGHWRLNS